MNGDGENTSEALFGQDIFPGNVSTGLLTVMNVDVSGGIVANNIGANTALITDLAFTTARRVPSAFAPNDYILPITSFPRDGLQYTMSTPDPSVGGTITTGLTDTTFTIDLFFGTQSIKVIQAYQQSTTFTTNYVYGLINAEIANWIRSIGSNATVELTLNTVTYNSILRVTGGVTCRFTVSATSSFVNNLGWLVTSPTYSAGTYTSPARTTVTPITVSAQLEWRSVQTPPPSFFIQNGTLSSVTCNAIGTNLVSVIGNMDMNEGNINHLTSVSSDGLAFTASCGQSQLQLASTADGISSSTTTFLKATNGVTSAALACTVDTALMVRNGVPRIIVNNDVNINDGASVGRFVTSGGYTSIRAGTGANDRIDIDGSSLYIAIQGLPVFYILPGVGGSSRLWSPNTSHVLAVENNNGVRINGAYYLPNTDGTVGQTLTTNGSGQASWTTPTSGLFSQTGTNTVNNNTEASLIQLVGSVGSLSLPANRLTLGNSFLLKIGGTFRDNSLNTLIRFRFKTNGINLLDTGNITLTNVNTVRAWNIEIQTTYNGVNMITNFKFSYTTPNVTGQAFHFQTSAPINATIINTLDLTANWTITDPNNTITSNYATLTKIY